MCIGLALGICFGLLIDNLILGICIGLALGPCLGIISGGKDQIKFVLKSEKKKNKDEKDDNSKE